MTLVAMAVSISAEPFPTRIRPNLAVCYQDLSDRYQRMPQSMDNLVALIRKIEAHQDTKFWDVTKMTATILHRYASLIQYESSPDNIENQHTAIAIGIATIITTNLLNELSTWFI